MNELINSIESRYETKRNETKQKGKKRLARWSRLIRKKAITKMIMMTMFQYKQINNDKLYNEKFENLDFLFTHTHTQRKKLFVFTMKDSNIRKKNFFFCSSKIVIIIIITSSSISISISIHTHTILLLEQLKQKK